jgi:putative ATP-dependent endonuclease of OLD family
LKISKIIACNFRLFSRIEVELRPDMSLVIGKNNSGKTSLLVLFEHFYSEKNLFAYDDFPIGCRKLISKLEDRPSLSDITIRMMLEIQYSGDDNLRHLSEFITDLDPKSDVAKILFECSIDQERLLRDMPKAGEERERFLRKNIHRYLEREVYAYSTEEDLLEGKRKRLLKKELKLVREIINFQFIHARRDVASSEGGKNVLSKLTTEYFNANNDKSNDFDPINKLMLSMDQSLEKTYKDFFSPFLGAAKKFLGIDDIKVISNLESKEILEDASQVVYGGGPGYLPETFNGLGHMNILYVLLAIEIRKEAFRKNDRQINLLFIEEPEAHTHPQMQYVFAREIKSLLKGIPHLQSVITTHSSHIVSQCDFKDIRYLQNSGGNIKIKNFHQELSKKYGKETESFQFVQQFLTLDTCELFFANKVIFIEGTTETMLLPFFISEFDKLHSHNPDYIPIASQNVTVVEAGANAKAFRHLLDFLEIKALVLTDIDTTFKTTGKNGHAVYQACKVPNSDNLSNETIKYYFSAPSLDHTDFPAWLTEIKEGKGTALTGNVRVAYQLSEKGNHARSFEDAFVHVNRAMIEKHLSSLTGLKNKDEFAKIPDAYDLVEEILAKKSDFAASLLFLALTKDDAAWSMPSYVKDGLEWIAN